MTRTEYEEQRKKLLAQAKQQLTTGDTQRSEETMSEVEKLDDDFYNGIVSDANSQAMGRGTVVTVIEGLSNNTIQGREVDNMTNKLAALSLQAAEYRTAWLSAMMGNRIDTRLMQAITSADGAIPTITANEIIRKAEVLSPLLAEIDLMHIAGNVKIAIESKVSVAAKHTENAEASDGDDALTWITLGGYEIIKIVRISATVANMSIDSFEDWLTTQIAEHIAYKCNSYIANGTGTNEPTGISHAREWDNTSSIICAAEYPTYKEICSLIGLLSSPYHKNAKFFMDAKTWWACIMPHRDDAKFKGAIESDGNGGYRLNGYPVILSDGFAANEVYFGDVKRAIKGNMGDDIKVAADASAGFTKNSIVFRGTCIFDCTVAVGEAVVKATLTTASTGNNGQ